MDEGWLGHQFPNNKSVVSELDFPQHTVSQM